MLAELRFLLTNADERCSASGPWVGWFSHAMPTAACIGPLLAAAMARKATRFARPTAVPLLTLNTAQLLRKGYWPGTGGSGRRHHQKCENYLPFRSSILSKMRWAQKGAPPCRRRQKVPRPTMNPTQRPTHPRCDLVLT